MGETIEIWCDMMKITYYLLPSKLFTRNSRSMLCSLSTWDLCLIIIMISHLPTNYKVQSTNYQLSTLCLHHLPHSHFYLYLTISVWPDRERGRESKKRWDNGFVLAYLHEILIHSLLLSTFPLLHLTPTKTYLHEHDEYMHSMYCRISSRVYRPANIHKFIYMNSEFVCLCFCSWFLCLYHQPS